MTGVPYRATELPYGWSVKPLKAVADYFVSNVDKIPSELEEPVRLCNYIDVYKNEFIDASSMEFMRSTASEREIEKFRLVEGDVVITKDSETWEDIAVPALVVESANDLVCGYHLAVLRPFARELDGRFLFRCLQSKGVRLPLELASTGVTRFGLPQGDIGRLDLPIPPLPAQRRITDYLDAETAEIDALIAEKERMLALLEEKRAALVAHAVTRGLNPNVEFKPTGLEWHTEISAHWSVRRLKFLLDGVDQGWSPQCFNYPADDAGWGVLKTGCVNRGIFREQENKALPEGVEPPAGIAVTKGDVLMSRASGSVNLIGSVARHRDTVRSPIVV